MDPTENLTYYDQEMQDCVESYCSFGLERIEEAKKHCPDPQILIEQRLDFSAIEARVLSWLAGEQWRTDVFWTMGISTVHRYLRCLEDRWRSAVRMRI